MFELSFDYRFEAAHRFIGADSPKCQTPHGHSWRARVIYNFDSTLGRDNMAREFGSLKSDWKRFIQETVDHSFLHHINDPVLPALTAAIPDFRGLALPGDPTTELVAATFLLKAMTMHRSRFGPKGLPQKIVVQETETNQVSFDAINEVELLRQVPALSEMQGWWDSASPDARECGPANRVQNPLSPARPQLI